MNTRRIVASMVVAVALCACGGGFQQATPTGFVALEDQKNYDYRAITADGMVVSVRELEHEPRGELAFWTEAIANHMRMRGGYALLDTREVKNANGLVGEQLQFGHDEGKTPHLYYVTVFVTDESIYVLEAGGTKEQMEQRADAVSWAIANFRVD